MYLAVLNKQRTVNVNCIQRFRILGFFFFFFKFHSFDRNSKKVSQSNTIFFRNISVSIFNPIVEKQFELFDNSDRVNEKINRTCVVQSAKNCDESVIILRIYE